MPLSNNFYPSPSDADQFDQGQYRIPGEYTKSGGDSQSISGRLETDTFETDDLTRIREEINANSESLTKQEILIGLARKMEDIGIGINEMRVDFTHRHLLSDLDVSQRSLWQ